MDSSTETVCSSVAHRRVRPTIHITDSCWINDPCAPGFDPKSGDYHLFYQCNPHGCEWGNMSWGHVTSRDLVQWSKVRSEPALKPDMDYDKDGVFTGCFVPVVGDDENLTVVYSSVRKLPFHWSTPPYPRNAAGISIATSSDGGVSWKKLPNNPVLQGEPKDVQVTGFRDPYIALWPALDNLRGAKESCFYTLVSGGFESCGPTTFLYAISKSDVGSWEYLGPLVDLPARFSPSNSPEVNFGLNWECTNFMSFEESGNVRHFLIIGAEGDVERSHLRDGSLKRTVRQQLWMCGDLDNHDDGIRMNYKYGGILDHGSYYAANSFHDPRSGKRIVHGWIPEEDCTSEFATGKGWNGSLALPREVFLLSIPGASRALRTPLSDLADVEASRNENGLYDLLTLGVKPLEDLKTIRESSSHVTNLNDISFYSGSNSETIATIATPAWELESAIRLPEDCKSFALAVRRKDTQKILFEIVFSPENETITIHRRHSDPSGPFNDCPEIGSFTLFEIKDPQTSELKFEELRLRVFSDGDILEVFANDRFALATMVYREFEGEEFEIVPSMVGSTGEAVLSAFSLWDGIASTKSFVTC
ncbi:Arabinanase/levansucrase/invertase [Pyrenochaeta sp. DS3sAY3a]|nr:Arabinanase/levansucrase/invertase [Pyrenochaeta sp. DS3sAY3a]